jgi:hypothetical protein
MAPACFAERPFSRCFWRPCRIDLGDWAGLLIDDSITMRVVICSRHPDSRAMTLSRLPTIARRDGVAGIIVLAAFWSAPTAMGALRTRAPALPSLT